jgi:hypothetical protein
MAACLAGAVSRWCLRSGDAGQAAAHGRRLALLAGNAWLIAALAADPVALAAGLHEAGEMLDRLLIPVPGVGVVTQILAGALTFCYR